MSAIILKFPTSRLRRLTDLEMAQRRAQDQKLFDQLTASLQRGLEMAGPIDPEILPDVLAEIDD